MSSGGFTITTAGQVVQFDDDNLVFDGDQTSSDVIAANDANQTTGGHGTYIDQKFTVSAGGETYTFAYVDVDLNDDDLVTGTTEDGHYLELISSTSGTVPSPGTSFTSASNIDQGADVNYADFGTYCFTSDTMIETDQGEVLVQDLEPGTLVRTRDNGYQPIRWIGNFHTKGRPVRIKAGTLGNKRDLVVSPRHRMVLAGWKLKMLFDHDHALVTALELVNDETIVRDQMTDVEYFHILFDRHEIIYAEGAATESFHPDQASIGAMDDAAREELFTLFPELRKGTKPAEAAPNLSGTQAAFTSAYLKAFVS